MNKKISLLAVLVVILLTLACTSLDGREWDSVEKSLTERVPSTVTPSPVPTTPTTLDWEWIDDPKGISWKSVPEGGIEVNNDRYNINEKLRVSISLSLDSRPEIETPILTVTIIDDDKGDNRIYQVFWEFHGEEMQFLAMWPGTDITRTDASAEKTVLRIFDQDMTILVKYYPPPKEGSRGEFMYYFLKNP